MRDATAQGGVISKEIKRIFQIFGEITDEDQEKDWTQNTALGHSNLDRARRGKDYIECHTLATRVDEVSKRCVELA